MTGFDDADLRRIQKLSDKEYRDEYVAAQVRTRVALLIRALREQPDRGWSQAELGRLMGKAQNVISRLEDPDYGKMSLSTLLEVAAAFDLPLWIDMPDWGEWLRRIKETPTHSVNRESFNPEDLLKQNLKSAMQNIDVPNYSSATDDSKQGRLNEGNPSFLMIVHQNRQDSASPFQQWRATGVRA